MNRLPVPIVVLPGANGKFPDFAVFRETAEDQSNFCAVSYPGWRYCVEETFSAQRLITDLTSEILCAVPQGPIRILGVSIGGHFGYAAALRLQALGREIAGFCAIDTFMVSSSGPRTGWIGRAMAESLLLLRQGRLEELNSFLQSRIWRSAFRLCGRNLASMLRTLSSSNLVGSVIDRRQIFNQELGMRLLIREVAPWIGALDVQPAALFAPAVLIRTSEGSIDDYAWQRRCPQMQICEIPGTHLTIFEPEYVGSLRECYLGKTRDWRQPFHGHR